MAKFILGNAFRDRAVGNTVARRVLWGLDVAFVGLLLGIFRILPVTWASALGARLGRLLGRILKKRTRHVRANLSLALPARSGPEIDALAGDVWANAGAVLAEYPNLYRIADPRRDFLEIEILARIPAYDAPDRPVVFVAAHMANWELAAAAIARLGFCPRIMYAPLSNPWLDRLMLYFRDALGGDLVSRSAGLRGFLDALRNRQAVAMIIDRKIEGGKPVEFFGAEKASSILPARLALRSQVPLVPVEIIRLPGARFRIRFHPPLKPADPQADLDSQTTDLTRQINAKFEDWIRARPGEWLCTSKIWPSAVLSAKTTIYEASNT
ncbi:lysophospholipid acyltransferase family protein [Roseovarius sp. D22-M7]|uniref:lysophospholipid acyltransferase family protein n=1 Tax=Roseovarius sp. D22-M7 TaxID=3127116 RepID=UPI00300F8DD7